MTNICCSKMKCAEFLVFGIVAISFISLCEGKVLTKSSLRAPDIPKETESFSIPPAKQRFAGRTGNINSDLQKRLDYTNPTSEEHHMDKKHGVFSGDSPIVISQESGSLETFGRALRQAADADDEVTNFQRLNCHIVLIPAFMTFSLAESISNVAGAIATGVLA
ncbi:hypothetical protein Ocin01_05454 [Orchesella cincta]|uniref:Uncharacterized protein n=1 Tax=Orchesella cincta TaxID=48709 RepID=A0A1D2N7K1_ORCCI|nr:hypothetical protein Ocin01_05454 [Orchesella cincta]